MSATDELRQLLDERVVAYHTPTEKCTYVGTTRLAELKPGEIDVGIIALTPQQAVEATLGIGEYKRGYDDGLHANVDAVWSAARQAVDDAIGRGTCEMSLEPGSDRMWWCSHCKSYHEHMSEYSWEYCPRCGAKAVRHD